jgi:hypothetical protein
MLGVREVGVVGGGDDDELDGIVGKQGLKAPIGADPRILARGEVAVALHDRVERVTGHRRQEWRVKGSGRDTETHERGADGSHVHAVFFSLKIAQ